MGFEYDPDKSIANKCKHGIDFEDAQRLWADAELVEIPARTTDEPRWLLIGMIDERHWSATITRRGGDIRIIPSGDRRMKRWHFMKAKTFDRKFDSGEKVVGQLNLSKARRIGTDAKRVNVDFPAWMVDSLDREARRLGVTRQSLIKLWLADKLEQLTTAGRR
jgi:uncharacterized DUF497 family protein